MSPQSCRHFRICFFVFALVPFLGLSQSTLRGKITDGNTGEPVAFANVFFSNTTMGSSTLEDGSFEIRNIPNGKYDLTVSVVGYKRYQQSIEFQGTESRLEITLPQDPVNLSAITIRASQEDYKKYYPTFKKYFLGQSSISVKCEIINPTDVHLYYDSKEKVLTGHASKPIVIENNILGYRIHYMLDIFEFNFNTAWKKLFGIARFEEIPPLDAKDGNKRTRKRDIVYNGSLTHFMRTLYNGSTEKEGFEVSVVDSSGWSGDLGKLGSGEPINLPEHISGTNVKSFRFQGVLRIAYIKEFEDLTYGRIGRARYFQTSFIKFKDNSINIFENGYYTDQRNVLLQGYLAWAETVGESLPASYYPINKKVK